MPNFRGNVQRWGDSGNIVLDYEQNPYFSSNLTMLTGADATRFLSEQGLDINNLSAYSGNVSATTRDWAGHQNYLNLQQQGLDTYAAAQANEQQVAQQNAAAAANQTPRFRPRGANESMTDYLVAKNAANPGSVNFGTPDNTPPSTPTTPTQTVSMAGNQDIVSQGVGILNEQDLQSKRQELTRAGVPQSEWSKYITPPDASGKLYWRQPATLYGPNGKKQVVATGSQEANDLFKAGWSLSAPTSDSIISSKSITSESPLNIGTKSATNTYKADTTAGGFSSSISEAQAEIDRLNKLIIGEAPDTENSKALDALLASLSPDSLTGRGAMQLSEEEKRGIEQKKRDLLSKSAELKRKTDEINALTASYNLANQTEEGRPQTLSRLQGAQAQNYKMYLAQKNSLTSDAAFIQSDLLAMQDQLTAAQEAANRAVDLMYADREAKYNATLQKINILQPQVEKEEARYLAGLKLDLEKQQDKMAEEKTFKKQIQDYKLQAIGLRLSNNVVNQIGQAKTIEDAYRVLVNNTPKKASGTTQSELEQRYIMQDMAAIRGIDPVTGKGDGFADTAKYQNIRANAYANGQGSWFDNLYPPQQVLNPNDPSALRFMQTPTQVLENIPTTPTPTNQQTISAAPKSFKWWDPRTWGNK